MLASRPLTTVQAARLRAYLAAACGPTAPALSEDPTIAELVAHAHVGTTLLDAFDCQVAQLVSGGAQLADLSALGYGARHLVRSPGVCAHLVSKFGATPVAVAVLKHPEDAVVLAGSALVVRMLGVSTRTLLLACEGDQASAVEVIRRLMAQEADERAQRALLATTKPATPLDALREKLRVGVLHGVGTDCLLRLGLDGARLHSCFGIDIHSLASELGVPTSELAVLNVFERPG